MFSFVYCNHRSLQCLPHRNVRIAREWNALALSIGTRRDPAPPCTIPFFFSFIFTFSPFRAMPPGLNAERDSWLQTGVLVGFAEIPIHRYKIYFEHIPKPLRRWMKLFS